MDSLIVITIICYILLFIVLIFLLYRLTKHIGFNYVALIVGGIVYFLGGYIIFIS